MVPISMGFILLYRVTEVGIGFETLRAEIFAVGLCQAQHTCVTNRGARLNVGNFQGEWAAADEQIASRDTLVQLPAGTSFRQHTQNNSGDHAAYSDG